MAVSTENIHTERVFQETFIDALVQGEGYERRIPERDYDRSLAMDKALVLRFIQDTQPEAWKKLRTHYPDAAEKQLFQRLEKALKDLGMLEVLRNGIKIVPNMPFNLCYFCPASALEPKRVAEYQSNILSAMDEVEYSEKSNNRLDMVIFVNGLPVITIEAKNSLTGTTFRDAEEQYCKTRPPAGEPLLTYKRGALVHFALDQDNVSMTTKLMNGRTDFLPFNRGRDKGAGNPDVKDEHRIAYLYKSGEWGDAIFSRSALLDIIGQFMRLDGNGRNSKLIFPRFQQLDAVRKVMKDAREHGTGKNYLIQHSAGSGKSNTIAWLAHHAINLHDDSDKPLFNTVIIVTDLVVLDKQLQRTVGQFEQTGGVVKKIEGTSRQLKQAIKDGARIIITTIQKFSTAHLKELSGQGKRNFAVIVDEAHSGQSGKNAQAMTGALTRDAHSGQSSGNVSEIADASAPETRSSDDIEDAIIELQRSRGPQSNISFFAFTATPRNVTLEHFGTKGEDGKPVPFHLYSMRQAIEEGFILDVLRNYMTYDTYYRLQKEIEDDPRFSERKGKRKIARYASLHPTAIGQKIEIIVEHFHNHVKHELKGQARAMIITQSREHAVRYFYAIKDYIERHRYDLKALVAFSGRVEIDGETVSESDLNGFAETELPGRFNGEKPDGTSWSDTYHVLIVNEKYQTGFDQPKLCAMYIDRKLSGLAAVQALSRLNRTMPGKSKTYILDFQNSISEIQEAFKPYHETTTLEATSDPNQIYNLQSRLFQFGYLVEDEIERFAKIYFKKSLGASSRARLEGIVNEAVCRFERDDNEKRQEEFRQLLKSFDRFYAFIAQIVVLEDTSLEKLAAYGRWLSKRLPSRKIPPESEITDDMLELAAFRAEKKEEGDSSLASGDTRELKPISDFGATPYTEEEEKELSELVRSFNNRHGTSFSEEDFLRFERVNREILDEKMSEMLRNNPEDVVYPAFARAFLKGMIHMFKADNEMQEIVMSSPEERDQATRHFFKRAMIQVKKTD